jgi:hypothetical protein
MPITTGRLTSTDAGWFYGFDPEWYLAENPDVAELGVDPFEHFIQYGWREGRNPHPMFDVRWFLEHNRGLLGDPTPPTTDLG